MTKREQNARQRERALQAGRRLGRGNSFVTPEKRLAIYMRDGFSCQYCGKCLKNSMRTLDHLLCQVDYPTGKLPCGKSVHHESNLIVACVSCNSGRGDRVTWQKYATAGARARIRKQIKKPLDIATAKALITEAKKARVAA